MISFGKKHTVTASPVKQSGRSSVVADNLKVKGDIFGTAAVEIAGELEGNVKCSTVHLHPKGKITGNVVAKEALIDGLVIGTINAATVTLSANANVKGEVFYDTLSIKDGAVIEGNCQKMSQTNKKSASAAIVEQAAPVAPAGDLLSGSAQSKSDKTGASGKKTA